VKNLDIYIFENKNIEDLLLQYKTTDFDINDNGDYKKLTITFKIGDNNSFLEIKRAFMNRFDADICFDDPFYLTAELLFSSHFKIATVESCTR